MATRKAVKKTTPKKTAKRVVSKSKAKAAKPAKLAVNQAWADLLTSNAKATRKHKLTDDGLVKAMTSTFPEKKGKSTITRVSMVRCCFNKGTGMFANFGPATPQVPAYDDEGNAIQARAKAGAKAKPAKKVVVKKKAVKKVVAKKKASRVKAK